MVLSHTVKPTMTGLHEVSRQFHNCTLTRSRLIFLGRKMAFKYNQQLFGQQMFLCRPQEDDLELPKSTGQISGSAHFETDGT